MWSMRARRAEAVSLAREDFRDTFAAHLLKEGGDGAEAPGVRGLPVLLFLLAGDHEEQSSRSIQPLLRASERASLPEHVLPRSRRAAVAKKQAHETQDIVQGDEHGLPGPRVLAPLAAIFESVVLRCSGGNEAQRQGCLEPHAGVAVIGEVRQDIDELCPILLPPLLRRTEEAFCQHSAVCPHVARSVDHCGLDIRLPESAEPLERPQRAQPSRRLLPLEEDLPDEVRGADIPPLDEEPLRGLPAPDTRMGEVPDERASVGRARQVRRAPAGRRRRGHPVHAPAVHAAPEVEVLLDVLGDPLRVLDDLAVHVHDVEGAVGARRAVHRPEPVVRRRRNSVSSSPRFAM